MQFPPRPQHAYRENIVSQWRQNALSNIGLTLRAVGAVQRYQHTTVHSIQVNTDKQDKQQFIVDSRQCELMLTF